LGYRTVNFERISTEVNDYQGTAVINYPDQSVPWTRIHEHKHFTPWEEHEGTAVFREFSKETETLDVPYYPKRLKRDRMMLNVYRSMAEGWSDVSRLNSEVCGVSFLGRLATYRYMDMETVIAEAIKFSEKIVLESVAGDPIPIFPNKEE